MWLPLRKLSSSRVTCLAVRISTGRLAVRSAPRIACSTSKPSTSGIIRSRIMASGSGCLRSAPGPPGRCAPPAPGSPAPARMSVIWMIAGSLSSTSRMRLALAGGSRRLPARRRDPGAPRALPRASARRPAASAPAAACRVKVEPLPGVLSTVMLPPSSSGVFLGDGQAQPGAAVLARGAVVGLAELVEDVRQLVGGDADAGVGHGDARSRRPPAGRTISTWPCSVNFTALPTRFCRMCRHLARSLVSGGRSPAT